MEGMSGFGGVVALFLIPAAIVTVGVLIGVVLPFVLALRMGKRETGLLGGVGFVFGQTLLCVVLVGAVLAAMAKGRPGGGGAELFILIYTFFISAVAGAIGFATGFIRRRRRP